MFVLKRKEVTVSIQLNMSEVGMKSELFNKKYEEVMSEFNNKEIVSINLIEFNHKMNLLSESYLIFYKEQESHTEEIQSGDLIYILNPNTREKEYQYVHSVEREGEEVKVFFLDENKEVDGFEYIEECTLVAKAKNLKV